VSKKRPHGEVRQSQVLMGYGPGAMMDLPKYSVIVGGLEHWKGDKREIQEERLVAKVQELLGKAPMKLYAPPVETEPDPTKLWGIRAFEFPTWFIALHETQKEGVRSRPLVRLRDLREHQYFGPDRNRYAAVPVRWVQGCPQGHVSDIDWHGFAHNNAKQCKRQLWIDEHGTSGDFAEIFVRCECGDRETLARAAKIGEMALRLCNGARPWIGEDAAQECKEPARLLVRTATNTYYAQTLSAISIPDADEALRKAVQEVYTDFLEPSVETQADVTRERKKPRVKDALGKFTDAEVFAEVRRRKEGEGQKRKLRQTEAEVFLGSEEEIGRNVPLDSDFYARALPSDSIPAALKSRVRRVVLAHRLRVVTAQVGFTRFEAETIEVEDELRLPLRRADLADEATWMPAIEARGEGVFVAFTPDSIKSWLKRDEVKRRGTQLLKGFDAWAAQHRGTKAMFPGAPYYMLHSLSHLLITSLSLECGYSASSIHERIYSADPYFGILLYSGTQDAEGTLGGLVEAGRRICDHLALAVEAGRLCSNDPVCSQHAPENPHEERFLHGASCHGCLLIAEPSCERRNEYLDRALVVPTVEGLRCEYFAEEK